MQSKRKQTATAGLVRLNPQPRNTNPATVRISGMRSREVRVFSRTVGIAETGVCTCGGGTVGITTRKESWCRPLCSPLDGTMAAKLAFLRPSFPQFPAYLFISSGKQIRRGKYNRAVRCGHSRLWPRSQQEQKRTCLQQSGFVSGVWEMRAAFTIKRVSTAGARGSRQGSARLRVVAAGARDETAVVAVRGGSDVASVTLAQTTAALMWDGRQSIR